MRGEIDLSELINKIKRGDRKAQERLYKYYRKKITYFLKDTYPKNYDIDDDTSEILIKIFESIGRYDENKSKFNTWVINIAKNYMIDKSRKKKPLYTTFTTNVNSDSYTTYQPSDYQYGDSFDMCNSMSEPISMYCATDYQLEMSSSICFASSSMDKNNFTMFNMKNSGYNYKEIAMEFNMSESQVSNMLNYTKTLMKNKKEE